MDWSGNRRPDNGIADAVTEYSYQRYVDVDRDMLLSALGNLLQNAFKFTAHGTEVAVHAHAVGDRAGAGAGY